MTNARTQSIINISAMKRTNKIRNVAFISGSQNGCTTLIESLLKKYGIRNLDNKDNENYKDFDKMTVTSKLLTLQYEENDIDIDGKNNIDSYLLNIMDTPGSISFCGETMSCIILSDGIIVVIDPMDILYLSTNNLLKYALNYDIKPVLFLNKMDIMFVELDLSLDEINKNLKNSIEQINVICNSYKDVSNVDTLIPNNGNIAFGSALYEWAFTLKTFGLLYTGKFGISLKRMMRKLWGNNYYDSNKKKWIKRDETGKLQNGFIQFILIPLKTIHDAIKNGQKDVYEAIIRSLRLNLNMEELQLLNEMKDYKDILKLIMNKWLPVNDILMDMMINYLPSPINASLNKYKRLYSGPWNTSIPMDWIKNKIKELLIKYENGTYLFCFEIICEYLFDKTQTMTSVKSKDAVGMTYCKNDSALIMYITKMIPTSNTGKFIVFGRVFSGTLKKGQSVRIMGPEYKHGKKRDLYEKNIEDILMMTGTNTISINECPAGNLCGVLGIDQYLLKYGTLSNASNIYPFKVLNFDMLPPMKIYVEPKNATHLDALVASLKHLAKLDVMVNCETTMTGNHCISGYDEDHLQKCTYDLRREFEKQTNEQQGLRFGEPFIWYRETIETVTGEDPKFPYRKTIISKSPNKHQRLYMYAEPLSDKFIEDLENGDIKLPSDSIEWKVFGRNLRDNYNWEYSHARKIWTFGCVPNGLANCLVDVTKGVQYLNEIKDHVSAALIMMSGRGVLCGEPMRGIRFNLQDVTLNADAIHRAAGQIIPCAKKAFCACQLASTPRLLEPYYTLNIIVNPMAVSGVYQALNERRGTVTNQIDGVEGVSCTNVSAYLPVSESYGFGELLRRKTGGNARYQKKLSHWWFINGCPITEGTAANKVLLDVRLRKGMKHEPPRFRDYEDRL